MNSFHHRPRPMSTHGSDLPRSMPANMGHQFRSESRAGFDRLGDQRPLPPPIGIQRPLSAMQHRPHHTFQPNPHHQTYDDFDSDEDEEIYRPRGSNFGDFDLDRLGGHHRRNSFGGGNMYGYGMGLMSTSPREHMLRAQMMRGDLYSMDPMMGRMGMGGPGYGMYPGGSMYGGGLGAGSMYGGMYGPGMMMGRPPMVGMGIPPMGGMGMYGRPYPYRMGGLVESHSPCLTRAKSWSAYGRMMY